jgi:hypothetical protein
MICAYRLNTTSPHLLAFVRSAERKYIHGVYVSDRIADHYQHNPRQEYEAPQAIKKLPSREKEVLEALAQGRSRLLAGTRTLPSLEYPKGSTTWMLVGGCGPSLRRTNRLFTKCVEGDSRKLGSLLRRVFLLFWRKHE